MPSRRKSRRGKAAANLPPKPQTVSGAANIQRYTPAIPAAPDPPGLGDAFDEIVTYMRRQRHRDLIPGARDYLAESVSKVIQNLQYKLRQLYINKDRPALYPDYVLDSNRPMTVMVLVPFALMKFHHLFEQYLVQMLEQCGLNATSTYSDLITNGYIWLHIKFQPGFIRDDTQTIKNRIFEVGYREELLAGVRNLRIES